MNLFCIQISEPSRTVAYVSNWRDRRDIFQRPDWMIPTHALVCQIIAHAFFSKVRKHRAKVSHMLRTWQLQRTYIRNCHCYLCVVVTDHRFLRKGCQA
jgi:hypothetical protein